jgi:hypothetical protein
MIYVQAHVQLSSISVEENLQLGDAHINVGA